MVQNILCQLRSSLIVLCVLQQFSVVKSIFKCRIYEFLRIDWIYPSHLFERYVVSTRRYQLHESVDVLCIDVYSNLLPSIEFNVCTIGVYRIGLEHLLFIQRLLVGFVQILAGNEVELVHILRIVRNDKAVAGVLNVDDRFENVAHTLLHDLTERMQVGRINDRRRENTLAVFAFAFAEELLPPFVHILIGRFVTSHDLDGLAFFMKNVADDGVAIRVVLVGVADRKLFGCSCRTGHDLIDINTGCRDRQQSAGSENRIPSADVVRNDKGFVAGFVGKFL